MTKSKSSASSIFVMVNDAQFLNATCVAGASLTVTPLLTKM